MKNYSLYAFHPERFDPRTQDLGDKSVYQWIESIPPHLPAENETLVAVENATFEWAKAQQENKAIISPEAEAIEFYEVRDTNYQTQPTGYYYTEILPSVGFDDFYYRIITTANANGLIVYSTLDEGLYYPNGTSEPEYLRKNLKQPLPINEAMVKILSKYEPNSPLTMYTEELVELMMALYQSKLERLGLTDIKFKRIVSGSYKTKPILISDYNLEVGFSIRSNVGEYGNKAMVDIFVTILPNNKLYNKQFAPLLEIPEHPTSSPPRPWELPPRSPAMFSKPKITFYSEIFEILNIIDGIDIFTLPHEKRKEIYRLAESKRIFSTVEELSNYIDFYINEVISFIMPLAIYEIFDKSYVEADNVLHKYFWSSPSIFSTKYYMFKEQLILLAYYVQYPNFKRVLDELYSQLFAWGLAIKEDDNRMRVISQLERKYEMIKIGYEGNIA